MPPKNSLKLLKTFKSAHNWLLNLDKLRPPVYSPDKIRAFLQSIGNPQNKYKVVHVGGTSGKGSVCAMLSAILIAAGYKVGLTVSPYLFSPCEKIQINGQHIPESDFIKLVNKFKLEIIKYGLTYFESFIALTLIYFQQQKVNYAVVEVGMGGRLDATNIFSNPVLVIITNIGLDHTDRLGDTKQKIAKEKAAIIKDSRKAITGSKLIKQAKYIDVRNARVRSQQVKTNLLGEFQTQNAVLATAAARRLKIPDKYIKQGLMYVKHPGRFEIIKKQPLIIRDGAHNPDKMRAFASSLKSFLPPRINSGVKKYLLVAIKSTKDYKTILKIITPQFDEIVFTSFDKSHDPKILQAFVPQAKVIAQPKKAYKYILNQLQKNDILVVTGSLYLMGEIWDR